MSHQSDMPPAEIKAKGILQREGFVNIVWRSYIDWSSHHDYEAVKDGIRYLIEVKNYRYEIDKSKMQNLLPHKERVLFLIVNDAGHEFIPFRDLEHKFQNLYQRRIKIAPNGRITIPQFMREIAGLQEGWVVVETYPNSQNVKSVNVRPDRCWGQTREHSSFYLNTRPDE